MSNNNQKGILNHSYWD